MKILQFYSHVIVDYWSVVTASDPWDAPLGEWIVFLSLVV